MKSNRNLQPIYPPRPVFKVVCDDCGERVTSENAWANLSGPAFYSYVCQACAKRGGSER